MVVFCNISEEATSVSASIINLSVGNLLRYPQLISQVLTDFLNSLHFYENVQLHCLVTSFGFIGLHI